MPDSSLIPPIEHDLFISYRRDDAQDFTKPSYPSMTGSSSTTCAVTT